MKMKRMIAWLLSLMLVFTMIPAFSAAVYAEDGNGSPAISIGAGNIEKGNKVYMGVRLLGTGPFTESPISWIVLGDANSTDLKNGDETVDAKNARLLITEKTQGGVQFDSDGQSNNWQRSTAKGWCSSFISYKDGGWIPATESYEWRDHFSRLEKTVMLSTSKEDDAYHEWGTSSLDNEQLFFLSAEEVSGDYEYFNGNDSRIAYRHDKDETWDWWLRSPNGYNSHYAARVTPGGSVDYYDVFNSIGARPAFNLNLNSVLFTSAAEGGKSSGACGAAALTAVSANTTNEWKMTLHDSNRDGFAAAAADGAVLEMDADYTDWRVPIVYSGASAANANDYVSVILADSKDNALYYGNIANKTSASSETGQEVNIPARLAAGNYKLYVFSEQINVDKMSDYASAFKTIALTVNTTPSEPIKTAIPTGKTLTYNGRSQTGVAAGTGFTLSGTTSAANAGSYQATATLDEGYVWDDGTSEPKTISWKIEKALVNVTAPAGKTFTYNGKVQTGVALESDYTLSGTAKATNAGSYTAKAALKTNDNYTYKWSDGTTAAKTINWKINKAVNTFKIKAKTATVKGSTKGKKGTLKKTKTLTVGKVIKFTNQGQGAKTYIKKSGNKKITIAKKTGKVTVKKGLKKGTYNVKVRVKANGTTNYKASAWKVVPFKIIVR